LVLETLSAAGRPSHDGTAALYGVVHQERSHELESLLVELSAGCLLVRCGRWALEITSDDARALAWRLLARAEQL